ncbi:hypothetical protein DL766_009886 [Monosporascus sp. MC13-8B]|uniref:Patatin-like phospholipase domain-containing protein n=1 Tax=Monosporascus cannonballus TaxID=155416 RepID=A0ABY0GTS2_9PEZI|nr:hypothetical protein DL762_009531 [Monosporascus cannonballus]RYP13104.1 hypothetical protein DL766_009886 [Monosporascus sp. MC13-8B]
MPGETLRRRVSFLGDRRHQDYGFPPEAFDYTRLPDVDREFLPREDLAAFVQALGAPEPAHSSAACDGSSLRSTTVQSTSSLDAASPSEHATAATGGQGARQRGMFISAQNDWAPVNERVSKNGRRRRRKRTLAGRRTVDETREGYLYGLLKWPFLFVVCMWIVGLGIAYLCTRFYIFLYEHFVAWRGRRERLRRNMRATSSYRDWVKAAKELDAFLGNEQWKEEDEYAYYDSKTVRRVWEQIRECRRAAEAYDARDSGAPGYKNKNMEGADGKKAAENLKALVEACVKNNFVGVENPRLYSQTYYGTKNLVQNFVDGVEKSVRYLVHTDHFSVEEKRALFKRLHANYGRSALCLSGGATLAYYHFGVIKALLEADLVPDIITGTSGGALIAALVATRTNDELKQLLVPALAHKIKACSEPITTWFPRWWKTGARFDSIDWARQCSWFTRGSMTFREAYERTGRILNVSCVPADPHSPTILCNYLTSPDCVIWSAVVASAAVPGILNPVVLMMKNGDGSLSPYSFGHKWKDGSLRTDIPIKALNLHFNVNFTIVSQVNPHISLFFFSSRGTVGSPVTHRRGRGWRGGFLGSATEQYIKLDLNKWLRVLRHLELLPRPLGQDWSQLWLQQFGGTVTIWPQGRPDDLVSILSDPDPDRLARMIHEGRQSAFPKLKFVANRLRVERLIEQGRRAALALDAAARRGSLESILIDEDDLRARLLRGNGSNHDASSYTEDDDDDDDDDDDTATADEAAVVEDGDFEDAVEGIDVLSDDYGDAVKEDQERGRAD